MLFALRHLARGVRWGTQLEKSRDYIPWLQEGKVANLLGRKFRPYPTSWPGDEILVEAHAGASLTCVSTSGRIFEKPYAEADGGCIRFGRVGMGADLPLWKSTWMQSAKSNAKAKSQGISLVPYSSILIRLLPTGRCSQCCRRRERFRLHSSCNPESFTDPRWYAIYRHLRPARETRSEVFRPEKKFGIPAGVDGESLIVKWPDGKEAKARINCREKIHPKLPQPGV
jgi:hypothetical protein